MGTTAGWLLRARPVRLHLESEPRLRDRVCALGLGGGSAMLRDPRDRLGQVLGVTGDAFKAQENGRELLMAGKPP